MVSTIDYISFKELELFKRKPFNVLVATILILIVVAYKPAVMLFIFSFLYVVSGPAITAYKLVRKRSKAADQIATIASDMKEKGQEKGLGDFFS